MTENEGPIKKGTAIFVAKPFAFVVNSNLKDEQCDHCLKSGKLHRCSGCEYVYYCNRTCQKDSWPVHKAECANLKRVSPKVVPDLARLMARIIVKLNEGGGEEVGYYSKTNYRKFKDLMSHYTDMKKDEKRIEHFMSLHSVLHEFLGYTPLPNFAELFGIYGRICINSFNIFDLDLHSLGIGIYLGPSIMDHSCKPNAAAVFDGPTIIIKTLEDLPYLDWSQIRISYIDILRSRKERRAELQRSYYFWCDCKKCEQSETMEDTAACPNKFCTYPCLPDSSECQKCGTNFPHNFKETFNDVSQFTRDRFVDMGNMNCLDLGRICLAKQEGVLHSCNMLHVRALRAAFDAAVGLQYWEQAELYAKQLAPGYLLYYGEIHPVTGVFYLMTGKILLHRGKAKQALEILVKANSVLQVTHGDQHTLVKLHLKPLLIQAIAEGR